MFAQNQSSSNPVMNSRRFLSYQDGSSEVMTVSGTVNKAGLLLLVAVLAAAYSWQSIGYSMPLFFGVLIGSVVLAFITYSKPAIAHITAPLYCALKGLLLGTISAFADALYPGLAANAVVLTFGILAIMLAAYKSGYVKATPRLTKMITFGLMAYGAIVMVNLVMMLFGTSLGLFSGPFALIFSLLVVGLASFSLVLDFDEIESGAASGAPKQMEWLAAFGLMVTLIWLYWEIVRLLMILQSSDD